MVTVNGKMRLAYSCFFVQDDAESDWDLKWDELFPENEEKILKVEEDSISELLDGVKHYNVTIPVPEVILR